MLQSHLCSAELQLAPRVPFHGLEVVIFPLKKSHPKASAAPNEAAALANMAGMQRRALALVSGKG